MTMKKPPSSEITEKKVREELGRFLYPAAVDKVLTKRLPIFGNKTAQELIAAGRGQEVIQVYRNAFLWNM